MKADNIDQKTVQVIAVQNDVNYYTQATENRILAAGLYDMSVVRIGGVLTPGFSPVEMDNDRPLEIDSTIQEIVEEFQDFFRRREIFKNLGFAHKRGYLFHGPPGCGKSSTLRLLETKFIEQFKGIVLFWRQGTGIEDYVEHIRKHEPDRPVMVVCEDIDGFIKHFEKNILEFLDGQKGLNNFILIATTNNLDAIPARIKDRPSRIDRVLEIAKPSRETREKYLLALKVESREAERLAEQTEGMTLAQLKEVVVATVCLGQSVKDVMARLRLVVDQDVSSKKDDEDDYLEDLMEK